MAAPAQSLQRSLHPRSRYLWTSLRTRPSSIIRNGVHLVARFAAKAKPPPAGSAGGPVKPIVLEQPAKFNPPSHGSRLPSKGLPKHYSPLNHQEVRAQETRQYPGLMAPKGTWAHWFWTSRTIHVWISVGTLLVLAGATVVLDFVYRSPFRHTLPPASDFWADPAAFARAYWAAVRLHERRRRELVQREREAKTNDAAKRRRYQAVHDLDKDNPIRGLLGAREGDDGEDEELRPEGVDYVARDAREEARRAEMTRLAAQAREELAAQKGGEAKELGAAVDAGPGAEARPRKWFGIF